MSSEPPPAREPSREDQRAARGYDTPKLDVLPEFLGFVAHALLIAVILWALGWSF